MAALGHKGNVQARSQAAGETLKNPEVQRSVAELRTSMAMDALEAVARMADIARASFDDFLDRRGCINIAKDRRLGKLHLIREYKVRDYDRGEGKDRVHTSECSLKLYDAQAAVRTLMQYHGLLSDILELRRLPKNPAELRQFIKDRLPLLFETTDPKQVH